VHDVLNLLVTVKKHGDVNKNRIGMLGHSMGGGITLRAIEVDKDIKASVIVAGVVASPQEIWELGKQINDPVVPDYIKAASPVLEAKYGTPAANPETWRELDPARYLKDIVGPVQLHHGTNDADVPKSFSDKLNERLKGGGKTVEYFEYPAGDHNLAGRDRRVFLQRTTDFLRRYLR
jgi:dipeptidyl aminopeptidase/acylaminoacyl peptidase